MPSQNKSSKGNTRREGLGFDGNHHKKLKVKKLTQEKLLTAHENSEGEPVRAETSNQRVKGDKDLLKEP